eukprot:scaffold4927_cov105-Cylindrotheca_fusiformis.AAC.2
MLIVAEDPLAESGASLAVATENTIHQRQQQQEPPLEVTRVSSFRQVPSSSSFDIVHVTLKSKQDAEELLSQTATTTTLLSTNCLGIQVCINESDTTNAQIVVDPDTAQRIGTLLQDILDTVVVQEDTVLVLTLDISLHLAMLQANCLPKTRSNNNNNNSFHLVRCGGSEHSSRSSIVVTYEYDWNNPFGGTDPLVCPSHEVYCVTTATPASSPSYSSSIVQAAAYTALQGLGRVSIVDSVSIAASVAATALSSEKTLSVPEIVNHHNQNRISTTSSSPGGNGILRQKYIEFGYK